ncbi:MAG: hypothetical protein HQL56_17560 [Magnetococcales bacterium]|nr:hypothetical protein [Magnetococcales bacterium]
MIQNHEIIKRLIQDAFISIPYQTESAHAILLKENDPQASLSKVYIENVPKEAVLIHMDQIPPPECLRENYRKRCDYTLVTQDCILFMEMKSSAKTSRENEIIQQFKGADAVLEFIAAASRNFLGEGSWRTRTRKYIIFVGGVEKRPTKIKKLATPSSIDSPAYLHVHDRKSITFHELSNRA